MAPNPDDLRLAQSLEPIFLMHREETDFGSNVPVDPKRWFELASLWSADAPYDDPKKWGVAPSTTQTMPRLPLVAAGKVSLVQSETQASQTFLGGNPTTYLLSGGRELFLDVGGWSTTEESGKVPLGSPGSDKVDAGTPNLDVNLWAIRASAGWGDLQYFRYRYCVEVVDLNSIEQIATHMRRDFDLMTVLRTITNAPKLILFYVLYPTHEEDLFGCQVLAAKTRTANFAGDWGCIAILLDGANPIFIGHSAHNAGIVEEAVKSLRVGMQIDEWKYARTEGGQHPVIYVSSKTHGHYLTPGDKPRPSFAPAGVDISRLGCGAAEDAYNAVRDADEAVNKTLKLGETVKDVLVILTKTVVGAGLGSFLGPLGAAIGALAGLGLGIEEAIFANAPTVDVPPALPEGHPVDQVPPQVTKTAIEVGVAIKPEDFGLLPDDIKYESLFVWNSRRDYTHDGRNYPVVVDRSTQIYWPATAANSAGFTGRWGQRVQTDPLDRRCGMSFPDFRQMFFRELALKLSQ
jgi:hypothetical protein